MAGGDLKVPQRVSPGIQNVSFNIHPKSNEKIYNDRRPHRDERNINKIFSDNRCSYSKAFTYCSANTEYMPFDKMLEIFHNANLHVINDSLSI